MTPENIVSVIESYEMMFRKCSTVKACIDRNKKTSELGNHELLSYAYYLCDEVKRCAKDKKRMVEAGILLSTVQMCLSSAGILSHQTIMNHNRP